MNNQPPAGYTATPPTEPGWYRVIGVDYHGQPIHRCINVILADSGKHAGKLIYWSESGGRWMGIDWVSDWWGPRVEF